MLNKILIPVGILFVANYILKKIAMAKNITFDIFKAKFNDNIARPELQLTICANNPVNTGATVSNIHAEIFFNNKMIGTAFNTSDIILIANGKTYFDLNVSIIPASTILSVLTIFKSFGGEVKIVGSSIIDGIRFPINSKYSV
jgi:LEA14-like dessication related protein